MFRLCDDSSRRSGVFDSGLADGRREPREDAAAAGGGGDDGVRGRSAATTD